MKLKTWIRQMLYANSANMLLVLCMISQNLKSNQPLNADFGEGLCSGNNGASSGL